MDAPNVFDPEYYQRLYEIEEQHWWAKGMRSLMDGLFEKHLSGKQTMHVLDAGCGTGYLLNSLEERSDVAHVVGFDLSSEALEFCRRRGHTRLALCSAIYPPFANESFDLILCIDTLQHLSPAGADETAMRAFARMLRPGGFVYLRTNSALGHRRLENVDANLYRRYRRPELKAMTQSAGLRVVKASYVNLLPSLWGMLREYLNSNPQPTKAIGPGLTIQIPRSKRLNEILFTHSRFEAWLIASLGLDMPFGHSLVVLAEKPME